MILNMESFRIYLYYVCSYKLIPGSKRFNVRGDICQRKSEFYTHVLILTFKLIKKLLIVYLRSDAKVLFVHHTICQECVCNISIHIYLN